MSLLNTDKVFFDVDDTVWFAQCLPLVGKFTQVPYKIKKVTDTYALGIELKTGRQLLIDNSILDRLFRTESQAKLYVADVFDNYLTQNHMTATQYKTKLSKSQKDESDE